MRIPTDITPLAYIAGSGSQFITTDIHLLSTDVVKSKWRFQNSAGNVYGCFTGSNDNDNFCLYAGSASTNAYIRYNGQLARNFKATSGTVYEIEQGPDGFFVGSSKVADFDAASFTCSAPMYIFMLPNSSSAKVTARCYYLQVIRGGEVAYDFIPARDEATGEVGMWEAVHGAWYGNDGTGAFTAGDVAERVLGTTHDGWRRRLMMGVANHYNRVLPAGYTRVQYLERNSSGPWINTGFAPNSDDVRVIIDFYCDRSGNNIFFGIKQYNGNDFALNSYVSNSVYYWWGGNSSFLTRGNLGRSLVEIGSEVKLDGTTVASLTLNKTFVGNINKMALFGQANATEPTTALYPAMGRIYEFWIYYGNTLKMHLIPCRDGNNVGYMYDTVSEQMLGNAGSGAFAIGPDL